MHQHETHNFFAIPQKSPYLCNDKKISADRFGFDCNR